MGASIVFESPTTMSNALPRISGTSMCFYRVHHRDLIEIDVRILEFTCVEEICAMRGRYA